MHFPSSRHDSGLPLPSLPLHWQSCPASPTVQVSWPAVQVALACRCKDKQMQQGTLTCGAITKVCAVCHSLQPQLRAGSGQP